MRILLLLLGRQLQALNYLRNSLSFGNALSECVAHYAKLSSMSVSVNSFQFLRNV